MFGVSKPVWFLAVVTSGILLVLIMIEVASPKVSITAAAPNHAPNANLIVWTDRAKYSRRQTLALNVALQNTGDTRIYVDRRMFFTGLGGGLMLEIRDENGNRVPSRILSDAVMPPPKPDDLSILVPLDEGFLYGTSVNLVVADFFQRPSRYTIRVTYKSWLRKETVAQQLRNLPAIWADAPEINSDAVSIEVTP